MSLARYRRSPGYYAYGLLTGVDYKKGALSGHLDLRASGDSANVQQVEKTDVERVAQAIRQRMAVSRQHDGAQPQAAAAPSLADQLRQLDALRQDGLFTDDEFATQKAKLLGT